MDRLFDALTTVGDLFLVVLGFSLIILIHEAGHFFAAKWAGIRVLAFALGFGPALVSFRKGLGVRRGSSEKEVHALREDAAGNPGEKRDRARSILSGVSPTEYRWNVLPFGGYVKMLGQDDADPTAVSDEPDSYQNCPPAKRMVVISAGVLANLFTAALMFLVVFRVGLMTEPAVVGEVDPSGRAAEAVAANAAPLGVTEPGLKPGDKIVSVDGVKPEHFNDVRFRVVYAPPSTPVHFGVERAGVKGILDFSIEPKMIPEIGLFSIGIEPMASSSLQDTSSVRERKQFEKDVKLLGLDGLKTGMTLVEADGKPVASPYELSRIINTSGGKPVSAVFRDETGKLATIRLDPKPTLQVRKVPLADGTSMRVNHLLGLTPVIAAGPLSSEVANAGKAGMKPGDVLAKIGDIEYPTIPAAIKEIHSHPGEKLQVVVLRREDDGTFKEHNLGDVPVTSSGTIGFNVADPSASIACVAAWPGVSGAGATPSGASLPKSAGARITAVDGKPVVTLGDVRNALQAAAAGVPVGQPLRASLTIELPVTESDRRPIETLAWEIPADEVASLRQLGWESPISTSMFAPEKFRWKADTSGQAITMAVAETRRNMLMTFLTIKRLFQRTVSPDNLKGPVGIAHVGVSIVDRGLIWLLFYMALISVNLAVINFLPIPITDGGHMLFLIYEQFTGRPPPVVFQNVATIAGLIVIGSLFLYVTFHDVSNVVTALSGFFGG